MPPFRVETDGFRDSEPDIRAVLDSAGRQSWRFFPGYKIEPFVVTRGHEGPITLFRRNDRGEIVVRLDTGGQHWSQYAYQFAHEFCHVLCGLRREEVYTGNKSARGNRVRNGLAFRLARDGAAVEGPPALS